MGLSDEEALWLGARHNLTGELRHSITFLEELKMFLLVLGQEDLFRSYMSLKEELFSKNGLVHRIQYIDDVGSNAQLKQVNYVKVLVGMLLCIGLIFIYSSSLNIVLWRTTPSYIDSFTKIFLFCPMIRFI